MFPPHRKTTTLGVTDLLLVLPHLAEILERHADELSGVERKHSLLSALHAFVDAHAPKGSADMLHLGIATVVDVTIDILLSASKGHYRLNEGYAEERPPTKKQKAKQASGCCYS
jgi:hypothetical protein